MAGQIWTSLWTGDSNRLRKWLYGSVLVRDWNSDGSTSLASFTPFDTDGNLKTTLLSSSFAGGQWYELGSLTESGVEFNPKFATEQTKIWQSRRAQRSDITEDDEEIMFSLAESKPIADVLRNNLPLSDLTAPGSTSYASTKPITTDIVYRQMVVIGVDGAMSNAEYIAEVRPRVALQKVGKRTFAAKSLDSLELTYEVHPDPASGFASKTLRGGPLWVSGSTAWPASQTAPVVSALTTGGKATITLAQPAYGISPYTYAVKTSADAGSTWVNATLDTSFNTVGYQTTTGTVTIKVIGVAAGAKLVQVFATGTNGSTSVASLSSSSATFVA
jgi:hypothetical protein